MLTRSRQQRLALGVGAILLIASIGAAAQDGPQSQSNEKAPHHCVALPHSVIDVSSGVSGRIEHILVKRGDWVSGDQVIAQLGSRVELANVELALARAEVESELGLREAALEFNRSRARRAEMLHARSVVSDTDREDAELERVLAGWRLNQARDSKRLAMLELRRAEQVLSLRSVRTPIEGVVVERFKSAGEFVDEEPLVRIAAFDPLHVEVIVPVHLHSTLRVGMHAEVRLDPYTDTPHVATVETVDAMADPASGTFRARLELPNPDNKLLAGVKCIARFPETPSAFEARLQARSEAPLALYEELLALEIAPLLQPPPIDSSDDRLRVAPPHR